MKKIKVQLVIFLIIILTVPITALAINDVTLNGITAFQLYTIDAVPALTSVVAGSVTPPYQQATSINVQNNYIDITLDNLSSVTFNTTAGGQYLQITPSSGPNFTVSPACVTSQATLTGTGGTVTLRLEVTSTQPGCATPSGGGGYTPNTIFPENYLIIINNGASCTESSNVTVSLSSQNTQDMIVGNNANFIGSDWEPFIGVNKSWTLEPGDGWKTVYALFRSSTGDFSQVISDSILVQSAGCTPDIPEPPEPIEPTEPGSPGGCTFIDCDKLDYNIYIINPDGTIRSMKNGFAQVQLLDGAIKLISFEDSGLDFDYNDVKILVDKRDCRNITITLLSVNGAWHHQVRIALIYNNVVRQDILLWEDSHLAIDETKTLNAYDYSNICEVEAPVPGVVSLSPGDLIKGSLDPVYYYGTDAKRHVFPSRGTYDSYYNGDFSKVKKISDQQLSEITLSNNMTYKPGARMIKIQSDPKVYAVDNDAVLRWVTTETVAQQLYGVDWAKYVDDLSPAFFTDYIIGALLDFASDFPAELLPNITGQPVIPPSQPSQLVQPDSCVAGIEFTQPMDVGSSGQQVIELQELLQCLGYFPDNITPTIYYGEITELAVIRFQQANNIAGVGSVGPITREALNKY